MRWDNFQTDAFIDDGEDERVEHNYHDHSNDSDTHEYWPPELSYHLFPHIACIRGSDQSFPVKLHLMLEEVEREGLNSIVSWQPHGRCFVVHQQKDFVDRILTRYEI